MATTVKELEQVVDRIGGQVAEALGDITELQGDVVRLLDSPPAAETISQLMVRVMREVGVVEKAQENPQFHYMFRGIDDVVNQVQPALVAAGVSLASHVVSHQTDTYKAGSGTVMRWAVVHMAYEFTGPMGDTQQAEGIGEAADASDKAHMKAMQQAYKYALLQVLAIPTHEPDADADSPEAGNGSDNAEGPPADYTLWAQQAVLEAAGGDKDKARQLWDHVWQGAEGDTMSKADAIAVAAAAAVGAQGLADTEGGDDNGADA